MGTLKRLQKLVWTKKAKAQSLDEEKPTLINLSKLELSELLAVKHVLMKFILIKS
jgi:hypothetical protein